MLDSEYDVVVVGAGPGGSATAKRCAELGLKTVMLEKRLSVGSEKRCGEGLSADAVEKLGQKIPRYCIMQDINGALVYAPSGKKITIDFGKTAGYILERKQYDKWLAEEAARAGVKVQAKTSVTGIRKENDFVKGVDAEFESEKFSINSKVVVAADGVESKVARWAGLNTTNKLVNIDSGFQYEMVDIEIEDPHKIILYFGNKYSPRGYLWIFPKGEDKANVGIGIGGAGGYGKTARQFLEEWIGTMPGLKKGSITEVNAGGIPVGGFLDNMVMNGLVIVGDAAHQVNPIHGGGMKEAAIAGKIAGEVIAEGIKAGDVSQKKLSKYNDLWWKERGNHLAKVQKLREVVEKMSDDDFNMLVDALSGEDLVDFTHGSIGKLAKILMKKPKLALLARHLL